MIKLKDILLENIERDVKYKELTFRDNGVPVGGMNYGILDFDRIDMTSPGLSDSDKAFYRLVGDNPFIKNVTVLDQYQKQGIATKLYDNMFNWLKEKGFKKVFSGKTINSQFVNNIWRKYKDGSTKINGHEIYFKNL